MHSKSVSWPRCTIFSSPSLNVLNLILRFLSQSHNEIVSGIILLKHFHKLD